MTSGRSRAQGSNPQNSSSWFSPWKISIWNPRSWRFDSTDFPFQLVDFSDDILVGWFFSKPIEKYAQVKLDHESPGIGVKIKTCLSCHHRKSFNDFKSSSLNIFVAASDEFLDKSWINVNLFLTSKQRKTPWQEFCYRSELLQKPWLHRLVIM